MSVDTFKPEVWHAVLLGALNRKLVYGSLVNRDFEGDISRAGDTVHINAVGNPTIGTYTPNSTSISPETLTTAETTLTIDTAKYFAFEVDDVDQRQIAGTLMTEAMRQAAYGMAKVIDDALVALYTETAAANALGTVAVTTADLAYQKLIALKVKLDVADVPDEGRWVTVPPRTQ